MPEELQITKPTFQDQQDQILQLVQYYLVLKSSKSQKDDSETKIVDEDFEKAFEELWSIYESSVAVIDGGEVDLGATLYDSEKMRVMTHHYNKNLESDNADDEFQKEFKTSTDKLWALYEKK